MAIRLKILLDIPEDLAKFALSRGNSLMYETFEAHGITFQYPADWEVNEQVGENEVLITVTSPDTAFWSVALFLDHPSPETAVETALNAFHDEYPELDEYESKASLCGKRTLARDLEFFCFELLNSAWIRAFSTPNFTALVLYQANDQELPATEPHFKRLCQSLQITGFTGA